MSNHQQYVRKQTIDTDEGAVKSRVSRAARCGLVLTLHKTTFWPYWRLEDEKVDAVGAVLTTGFDIDVDRALGYVEGGGKLHEFDPYGQSRTKKEEKRTPGGAVVKESPHVCIICGVAGGLPSPKMALAGQKIGVKWKAPVDPATGEANVYLHPGACRKQLRKLIDTNSKSVIK